MDKTIIDAQGLSKRYCMDLHLSLRYGVYDIVNSFRRASSAPVQLRQREFWALKDVSFKLDRGSSLGILGKNGAGKSTLMKLMNGTIKPTTGRVSIHGHLRMLALGAGFNPMLTGRENAYTSCSLSGYDKRQTEEKIDEIIDFAGIGEFIDSPVRTYSTGMGARLGFAVAIHTNPDILLVDEALAVGDIGFASKCLRKIRDFREKGGTLFLVTHAPYTVRAFCDEALWIDKGMVQMQGKIDDVCVAYEKFIGSEVGSTVSSEHIDPLLESCSVTADPVVNYGESLNIKINGFAKETIQNTHVYLSIFDANQTMLFYSDSKHERNDSFRIDAGAFEFSIRYDDIPLTRGGYYVTILLYQESHDVRLAFLLNAAKFSVETPNNRFAAGIVHLPSSFSLKQD